MKELSCEDVKWPLVADCITKQLVSSPSCVWKQDLAIGRHRVWAATPAYRVLVGESPHVSYAAKQTDFITKLGSVTDAAVLSPRQLDS